MVGCHCRCKDLLQGSNACSNPWRLVFDGTKRDGTRRRGNFLDSVLAGAYELGDAALPLSSMAVVAHSVRDIVYPHLESRVIGRTKTIIVCEV